MSIHWKLLRLHLLWFILYNLLCLFILLKSGDVRLTLLIKIAGYPAIHLISRPFNRRYDYYFKNMGFNPNRLFLLVCLFDTTVFSVLIVFLRFLF
jgi:hypothetical protein